MSKKNAMKKIIILITLLLMLQTAFPYHADITIQLHKDGSVTIKGDTDYPLLQNIINSQNYTSKKGEYWTFNLTTKDILNNYSYLLIMPDNVVINYIKTTPNIKIITNDHLELKGYDKHKKLVLIVQYKFIKPVTDYIIYIVIILIIPISLLITSLKKKKQPKELEKIDLNIKGLTERQKEILKLIAEKGKISQKEISKELNIPKSSVSRNINVLVAKKIVKKIRTGQTTYISIQKSSESSA